MESGILNQIGALSYIGLFGISLIANVLVPVPEEIIILAIGYTIGKGHFMFFPALIIIILGTCLVDLCMFWLSRTNNKIIVWFYQKIFSKIFPIRHEFLVKHAERFIFISRFLVQLRFLGPFIAGQVKVPWKKFMLYDFAAVVVYITSLLLMGSYFAKSIDKIFSGVHIIQNSIIIVICLFLLWSVGKFLRTKLMEYAR